MSGTHQTPNNPSHSTFKRGYARDETKRLLLHGLKNDEEVLVQPPPTIHPEKLVPKLVAAHDLCAVYTAPTKRQLARIEQRFNNNGVTTQRVRSQYDLCGSYSGAHNNDIEERVKDHIERGATLGNLHEDRKLPCQPGCPFGGRNPPPFTEQVILAHPKHIYMDRILEDRHIFTCSLRGDAYITELDNPPKKLNSYIDTNTDFIDYRDFMRNRDMNCPPFAPFLSDYPFNSFEPSDPDKEFGYDIDKDGHHLAPLAVFGLLHSEKLPNGWETSYHRRESNLGSPTPTHQVNQGPNPFEVVGLDYQRHRVVREPGETPEDDTLYVLKVPNYSKAKNVVAFDIAPTSWMWNLYYGADFDHQRVYSDDETAEFLHQEMDTTVIQTATRRKPYDSSYHNQNRSFTPGRDASIAVWATGEFGKRPHIVSTNKGFRAYDAKQPALLRDDAERGIQYRRGESVITDDAPLVILNGSPRPQNEEFQLWGALAGKSVPGSPNQQGSFGRVGDEVRHQFSESRVGKWATRFTSKDATLVLNTTAVPELLQDSRLVTYASPTDVLTENSSAKRKVARFLRQQAKEGERATIGEIESETGVSRQTIYTARDDFEDEGWITAYHSERPTEYEWDS
ncbi:hypothetical protein [Haloplanus salilacus]|uniref:hypothetical protein n=1 Tax=Haloplanus salilacus TaxID=2949994 RepID=UPI0030CF7CFE